MARIAGTTGRLYVGVASSAAAAEPIAYISKMALDFSTDDLEVTAMGDVNKVYVAGMPDCSGSFSGFYDDATAQTYTAARDGAARNLLVPEDAVEHGSVLVRHWPVRLLDRDRHQRCGVRVGQLQGRFGGHEGRHLIGWFC